MIRAVLIGDSIMGDAADGNGGLGRALASFLPQLGVEVIEAAGVGGSTVANWLHASGFEGPGKGYVMGRWGDASKMTPLTDAQRRKAQLKRLIELPAEVWWVNFGHNDFNSGRPPAMWADQAMRLLEIIPSGIKVIWSEGNDHPPHNEARKHGLALLRAAADKRWPGRVLVLDTAGARRAPYVGRGVHPSAATHRAWLGLVRRDVEDHLRGTSRRNTLQQGLGALAVGLVVFLGGGALIDWLDENRRRHV